MGTTKRQVSSHGAESKDKPDLPSSDAGSRVMPVPKPLHPSSQRASSRAPKRIKRPQDPKTPTTQAAKFLKPITTSKEHWRSTMKIGRKPLADLGSAQGPGPLTPRNPRHQEHHTPIIDGAGAVSMENDQLQISGSDEDSFGGGDMFTSTDQQQLSALHSDPPRHYHDETTTDF